jgi:hypothetical protein
VYVGAISVVCGLADIAKSQPQPAAVVRIDTASDYSPETAQYITGSVRATDFIVAESSGGISSGDETIASLDDIAEINNDGHHYRAELLSIANTNIPRLATAARGEAESGVIYKTLAFSPPFGNGVAEGGTGATGRAKFRVENPDGWPGAGILYGHIHIVAVYTESSVPVAKNAGGTVTVSDSQLDFGFDAATDTWWIQGGLGDPGSRGFKPINLFNLGGINHHFYFTHTASIEVGYEFDMESTTNASVILVDGDPGGIADFNISAKGFATPMFNVQ